MNTLFFIILSNNKRLNYFSVKATNIDRAKEKIKYKLLYFYSNILKDMNLNTLDEVLWEIYEKTETNYSDIYTIEELTNQLNEKIYT